MKNRNHKEPMMSDAMFYSIMSGLAVVYLLFYVFASVGNV